MAQSLLAAMLLRARLNRQAPKALALFFLREQSDSALTLFVFG